MNRRDTELPTYLQHKSPADVARYMRTKGKGVGREYKTHGSVWAAPDSLLQVGLLHLVVDELEKIRKELTNKPGSMMEGHSAWLFSFHDRAKKAIKNHEEECARISKFCELHLLKDDVEVLDIHALSFGFREDFAAGEWRAVYNRGQLYRHKGIMRIEEKVKRLKSVRNLDDIEKLSGIGPKTAAKIREKMAGNNGRSR